MSVSARIQSNGRTFIVDEKAGLAIAMTKICNGNKFPFCEQAGRYGANDVG
jgi:hypothetical protein